MWLLLVGRVVVMAWTNIILLLSPCADVDVLIHYTNVFIRLDVELEIGRLFQQLKEPIYKNLIMRY